MGFRPGRRPSPVAYLPHDHLEAELGHLRPQSYQDGLKIGQLEDRIEVIAADNARLKQRLADSPANLNTVHA